jgi:tRNA pseudouridine55 synthase
MATGVLVVAIGEATKLVPYLTGHAKTYEATVLFGKETHSLDATGTTVAEAPVPHTLLEALSSAPSPLLDEALRMERERTSQVPPLVSAIHVGGERAYAIARRGETAELEAREIAVRALDVLTRASEPPSLGVRLDVAKGYFVRAFARDLAHSLGTLGHLSMLRRIRSGPFTLERAATKEMDRAALERLLVPLEQAAAMALPPAQLTETGERDARAGRRVRPDAIENLGRGVHAWFAPDGALVAVGERDEEGNGRVVRGFVKPAVGRSEASEP